MGIAERTPKPSITRTRPTVAVFSSLDLDLHLIVEDFYLKPKLIIGENLVIFQNFPY